MTAPDSAGANLQIVCNSIPNFFRQYSNTDNPSPSEDHAIQLKRIANGADVRRCCFRHTRVLTRTIEHQLDMAQTRRHIAVRIRAESSRNPRTTAHDGKAALHTGVHNRLDHRMEHGDRHDRIHAVRSRGIWVRKAIFDWLAHRSTGGMGLCREHDLSTRDGQARQFTGRSGDLSPARAGSK